jgi:hypothetical protein
VSRPVMTRPAIKAIVVRSFGCMAFIPHSNLFRAQLHNAEDFALK